MSVSSRAFLSVPVPVQTPRKAALTVQRAGAGGFRTLTDTEDIYLFSMPAFTAPEKEKTLEMLESRLWCCCVGF